MSSLLGVNIDHVATVRQARKEIFPDPSLAALEAVQGGAEGITAHLREDRRHIQDNDLRKLKSALTVPLNMEMAATPEILSVADQIQPAWVCLVPEKRKELTTESGLSVREEKAALQVAVHRLKDRGIKISFFIDPDIETVKLSKDLGADAVELHTGVYARLFLTGIQNAKSELTRLKEAARAAEDHGLLVNAGHGIDYNNVVALLEIFPFHELNIGFSIISRSLFVGIRQAVYEMKEKMKIPCAAS